MSSPFEGLGRDEPAPRRPIVSHCARCGRAVKARVECGRCGAVFCGEPCLEEHEQARHPAASLARDRGLRGLAIGCLVVGCVLGLTICLFLSVAALYRYAY